jgi:flagellar hook assembly protein FlgD
MLGREVKTLVNTDQQRGIHNVVWNADNNFGAKVSSGMYIYRVVAGNKVQVRKMVLLK